jgi:hypothetical protein
MYNPHKLSLGVSYWTSNPFTAMSKAAQMGRKVGRYPSGQYEVGMICKPGNNFYGYGVCDPDGGFTLIDWKEMELNNENYP